MFTYRLQMLDKEKIQLVPKHQVHVVWSSFVS